MTDRVISTTTPLNTTIKIMYQNSPSDMPPMQFFVDCLSQIENNILRYVGREVFNGVVIEIWHQDRGDLPTDIATLGGLTNWNTKLVQCKFKDSETNMQYVSAVFSHEFGHIYQGFVGYPNSPNDIIKSELFFKHSLYDHYDNGKMTCSALEMFAEYFKELIGANASINQHNGNYPVANTVQGLKDTFLLYKPINDYIKNKNVANITFQYNAETRYAGIMFIFSEDGDWIRTTKNANTFSYTRKMNTFWVFINRDGVYNYKNNSWIMVKEFK